MKKDDEVVIELRISSCARCPHSSNNAQEHNDPFTSSPSVIYWYCNQGEHTRDTVNINKPYLEIAKNCPLRGKNGK